LRKNAGNCHANPDKIECQLHSFKLSYATRTPSAIDTGASSLSNSE
jgi:hypothetical protein